MKNGEKVLVAIDLGASADEAVRQADEWAFLRGAPLAACFVVPSQIREHSLFPPAYADDAVAQLELERRAAELVTERIVRLTQRSRDDFEVIIEGGRVDIGIARVAAEEHASVVVIGNRRSSDLERVLLGSISERVVRYADCSVLVARSQSRTGKVLAATDLSEAGFPAVAAAAEAAVLRGSTLTILHVVDAPASEALRDDGPGSAEWSAKVGSLTAFTAERGLHAAVVLRQGAAAEAIVGCADELGADLIVVGTRARTGLMRLAYGSVAETVARTASCSVLAVRLGAEGHEPA
jgi:nucleotide-binding universal stress UspA family protein